MIYPEKLERCDKVAIISPATVVKGEYIDGLCARLEEWGLEPVVAPHAKGPACGTYAASADDRLADLLGALNDPEIKAIFCARGGYGCIQLIGRVPVTTIRENPKWLIGFSDVSALHAMMLHGGVASIHGPMAKHFTLTAPTDPYVDAMHDLLFGQQEITLTMSGNRLNHPGRACGRLVGGNLAVLNGLAGTDFDLLATRYSTRSQNEPHILFIEDIGEQIYEVERMLYRLHLSGALNRFAALIIGEFTEYHTDANYAEMQDMISDRLKEWGYAGPVWFDFPVGHTDDNIPLVEGAWAEVDIDTKCEDVDAGLPQTESCSLTLSLK